MLSPLFFGFLNGFPVGVAYLAHPPKLMVAFWLSIPL